MRSMHLLDCHAADFCVGMHRRDLVDDLPVNVPDLLRRRDVEPDAPGVRLVRDIGRQDLHGDGKADRLRNHQRLVCRVRDAAANDRNIEGRHDGHGFRLGEHFPLLVQNAFDDQPCAFPVGRPLAPRQASGRLQQQPLVAVVGGNVGKRVDRVLEGAKARHARLAEQFTRLADLRTAQPGRHHQLVALRCRLDDRTRDFRGPGHGLWSQDDKRTVDARIGEAELDCFLVALGCGVADDVHGIATGPDRRQDFVQGLERIPFDARQFDALVAESICCHDAGTASVGDDHEAFGRAAVVHRRQGSRGRKQLADGFDPQHARSRQGRRECLVAAGQRSRV